MSSYKLYQIVYVDNEGYECVTYLRGKTFWEIYEYLNNDTFREAMVDIISIVDDSIND